MSNFEPSAASKKASQARRNLSIIGVLIVVALVTAGYFGFRQDQEKANTPNPNVVGSCWYLDGDENFNPVECTSPLASFITTDVVKAASTCDDIYLKSDRPGEWLCVDLKIKHQ